jgi:DNA polymerase-1
MDTHIVERYADAKGAESTESDLDDEEGPGF